MRLDFFRKVQAVLSAVTDLLVLIFHSDEASTFNTETLEAKFPELNRAVRRLEYDMTAYEHKTSLEVIEEVLGDAQDLLDCFDPAKYYFDEIDAYDPAKLPTTEPEAWGKIVALRDSLKAISQADQAGSAA